MLPRRYKEERPWGSFDQFTLNEPSTVKILHVLPHKRFSLQRHSARSEFWRVIAGSGVATVGEEERTVNVGDEIEIVVGQLHSLAGGDAGISVLEISIGTYDENDIDRVEDDFGRVSDAPQAHTAP